MFICCCQLRIKTYVFICFLSVFIKPIFLFVFIFYICCYKPFSCACLKYYIDFEQLRSAHATTLFLNAMGHALAARRARDRLWTPGGRGGRREALATYGLPMRSSRHIRHCTSKSLQWVQQTTDTRAHMCSNNQASAHTHAAPFVPQTLHARLATL